MDMAIEVARETPPSDVPVGAVIVGPGGEVLGRGTNRREADSDPLAHAEILAIRETVAAMRRDVAGGELAECGSVTGPAKLTGRAVAPETGDAWRLTDCTLAVTLEPCTMCAGALVGARIGRIIFGAYEPKTGACGSVFDVVRDPAVLHRVEVIGGVRETECAAMMSEFFEGLRAG